MLLMMINQFLSLTFLLTIPDTINVVLASDLEAEQDPACSGNFYFTVASSDKIFSNLPPSNVTCIILNGTLELTGYRAKHADYIPKSIKSIQAVKDELSLWDLEEYPTFLNTVKTVGSLSIAEIYGPKKKWNLHHIQRIYKYLNVFNCDYMHFSFPNLVELGDISIEAYFTSTYVDAPKVTESGAVYAYGLSNPKYLFGLKNLKKIHGYLILELIDYTSFSSLGLDSLTSVTRDVIFSYRYYPRAPEPKPLIHSNLPSQVTSKKKVGTLVFKNQLNIGKSLIIDGNEYGFKLKVLNGGVHIGGSFSLDYYGRVDLTGMGVVTVQDSIYVYSDKVKLFDTSKIVHLNGDFDVLSKFMKHSHSFANLRSIGGTLTIPYDLKQGRSFSEYLPSLRYAKNIRISQEANIKFVKSVKFTGSLKITYNYDLETLYGLEHIKEINGSLIIRGNRKLVSTKGLNNLVSVNAIYMDMSNQQILEEIAFGKNGSNLGYPYVKITKLRYATYLDIDKIKSSFSSICNEINQADEDTFECNNGNSTETPNEFEYSDNYN